MIKHEKYDDIEKLINAEIQVLVTGEAGTGKSTLIEDVATNNDLIYHELTMTKQTTLSHLMGFTSINGTYISTQFRKAFEEGNCIFCLSELDAGDPNVLLALNSIENGYISFPDKRVNKPERFTLVATANPQDQHNIYTGRSKLDKSTMDRFEEVVVNRDDKLELMLTDIQTHGECNKARELIKDSGSSHNITMRDAIRLHKKRNLSLEMSIYSSLFEEQHSYAEKEFDEWIEKQNASIKKTSDANTLNELFDIVNAKKQANYATVTNK